MKQIIHANVQFGIVAFVVQVAFLVIFGTKLQYGPNTTARTYLEIPDTQQIVENPDVAIYQYLKDVEVMMVVGSGFLMIFLRKHGYNSMGCNLFLCALVIQWALIMNGTTEVVDGIIYVDNLRIIRSLFTLATVLISFGAVLGKVSHLQMLIMAVCEIPIVSWNEYLGIKILHVIDTGESIFIHCFGAYFGLGVSLALYNTKYHEHPNLGTTYISDLLTCIGTLFLWIYWPSFNAGTATGREQSRALVNTILALCGATLGSTIISAFIPELEDGFQKHQRKGRHQFHFGRYNMVYFQNSTLAGGVAIGSAAAMELDPCLAILIGFIAGVFSVLGYRFFTKYVNKVMHDTCGVHNLYGFPSFISAIASACAAALATRDRYGDELYYMFPALSPQAGVTYRLSDLEYTTELNLGRTPLMQGGFQIAGWCHTFIISLAGGIITGM
ncbi:hypothetical protein Ciccas_012670 [Cichlidogyrus casuarinus]|uniref:Ammonium transporter AmtB-like domain-containing protein n=1 Tax=Cichlidogyrus casuarinus TaxID=1844966 RepID=A0ABD2PMQ2_9PLAT